MKTSRFAKKCAASQTTSDSLTAATDTKTLKVAL